MVVLVTLVSLVSASIPVMQMNELTFCVSYRTFASGLSGCFVIRVLVRREIQDSRSATS
jgi:hypothetical protein